jgi:SAM-dependent MidA family methyltransferase
LLRLLGFFGLLRLGQGRAFQLLYRLAELGQLFPLCFELGTARGDLLEQFVSRVLAQACEFFDAQRIQINLCHWNLLRCAFR